MKLLSLVLLAAAPFISALSLRNDARPSFNPPQNGLNLLKHESALARSPERAGGPQRSARGSTPKKTSIQGGLLARDDAGNDLGYVGWPLNDFGEYGLTSNASESAVFSADVPSTGSAFDMNVGNAALPAFPLLGATSGYASDSSDLGRGSSNYLYLTGMSSSTGVGAVPADVPNTFSAAMPDYDERSESTIWTWNSRSSEIAPHWTNTDGTRPHVQLAWHQYENVLFVVGDIGQFKANFGGPSDSIVTVHLYLKTAPLF